jgi:hypothetical protein
MPSSQGTNCLPISPGPLLTSWCRANLQSCSFISANVRHISRFVCFVRSEVFTAVTMKNVVFWDVTPCGSFKNQRFGGTSLLHQSDKNRWTGRNVSITSSPDDGGATFLRNVGCYKSNTA